MPEITPTIKGFSCVAINGIKMKDGKKGMLAPRKPARNAPM
jgi:hypothetical protein